MSITIKITKDKILWDQYVSTHPSATPYHKFAWLESVNQAYGHTCFALLAQQQGKVVGILPIVLMRRPFSKGKFCSLPFCDLGHALVDNKEVESKLFDFSIALLNEKPGRSFEYRDTETVPTEAQVPSQKVRMVMPLPEDSNILLNGFKSKLRSQIRKSEKNGLTCVINNSQHSIENFYQIFAKNMHKLGSPVHSKQWFEALFEHYAKDIFLAVVYHEDKPVGAGIVLKNNTKMAIPWASTDADFNYLAPNMMLYWSLLKLSCEQACTEFDFGRSTFGEGTYKFKQQWGALPVPLVWSDLNNPQIETENDAIIEKNKLRSSVEKLWSQLPIGFTTFIGPQIRKHISL